MKKNLVFVLPSLDAGGAEKSAVSLLNAIDFNNFNVDLILLHKKGIFLKLLPTEVSIIEIQGDYQIFKKSIGPSLNSFLKKRKLSLVFNRLLFALKNYVYRNKAQSEQCSWRNLSSSIDIIEKKYDVAIGFLEKSSIYLVVDKIQATKKIGWIHTNYSNSGMDKNFDQSYFKKLNHLVAVSKECATDLQINFPLISPTIHVIQNIISPKTIQLLANREIVEDVYQNTSCKILTIGRLSHEKGIDLALEAAKQLLENGLNFKWVVIGDGQERMALMEKIRQYKLEKYFVLLGLKDNPYPYLKQALIYVQPSRYEGKSIAIDEAKIMSKSIVVTNFSTVNDQIINNKNGIIVKMNPESIVNGIRRAFNDKALCDLMKANLQKEELGTENEIENFYQLLSN